MNLRYAWYGDDFTGASDTLATLAQAGLKAMLFLDVPTAQQLQAAGPLDALGIAGAARSMAPAAMRRHLEPIATFLASCGAPLLHYKCCSTFDSAPHIGSIGAAVNTLGAALHNPFMPIVGGQPSLGRYCAFGQLFATSGSETFRIDRHPTMSVHPVTPMQEADLRRHLAAQGLHDIALVDLRAHEGGALEAPHQAVLFDVTRDAQLARIGELLWQRAQAAPVLTVGASSVAQALIDHWGLDRATRAGPVAPARTPVFVLAGSLSPLSALQAAAATSYTAVALDAESLAAGHTEGPARQIAALLNAGRHVIAHTARPGTHADPALAPACGQLLRSVLRAAPISRVGVAGGDTSSHAVQALAPWGLEWLGRPAPGVALCRARADDAAIDGLELMLKGGQMGGEDLFERLVSGSNSGNAHTSST